MGPRHNMTTRHTPTSALAVSRRCSISNTENTIQCASETETMTQNGRRTNVVLYVPADTSPPAHGKLRGPKCPCPWPGTRQNEKRRARACRPQRSVVTARRTGPRRGNLAAHTRGASVVRNEDDGVAAGRNAGWTRAAKLPVRHTSSVVEKRLHATLVRHSRDSRVTLRCVACGRVTE